MCLLVEFMVVGNEAFSITRIPRFPIPDVSSVDYLPMNDEGASQTILKM